MDCLFIEKDVHDVMINHFHTIMESEWNLKDET
jgi:hypothetical protein